MLLGTRLPGRVATEWQRQKRQWRYRENEEEIKLDGGIHMKKEVNSRIVGPQSRRGISRGIRISREGEKALWRGRTSVMNIK